VVAVSDAHERRISTDLLLGLLKKVQRVRRDLRVVIITTPPTAATFRWARHSLTPWFQHNFHTCSLSS
jgi:ATP-dependent RNA helicase DDX35